MPDEGLPPGRVGAATTARPGRRRVLAWWATGGLLAPSLLAACSASLPATRYTVARWVAERGDRFLVGHRGAADVVPEHTLESYRAALAWGARAVEVSAHRTLDGGLVCLHDATLDRTTTLTGPVARRSLLELRSARVDVARLGPAWQGAGRPRVPLLADALDLLRDRAVVCLEAKDPRAYDDVMQLVRARGMSAGTVVKVHHRSSVLDRARGEGWPVFGYFGDLGETTPAAIASLASRLDPRRDVMVLPAADGAGPPVPDGTVRVAVDTGVPVWVFPVHRRAQLAHLHDLGVVAAVTPSIGYLSGTAGADDRPWPGDRLAPGVLLRDPGATEGLHWPAPGEVALATGGSPQFVLLGEGVDPGDRGTAYRLDLQLWVDADDTAFSVAVGHADDAYYEDGLGVGDGYHATVTAQGDLRVAEHVTGRTTERVLASVPGGNPRPTRSWLPLRLEVTPAAVRWQRLDTGAGAVVPRPRWRGPYVHVGRPTTTGRLALRQVRRQVLPAGA